MNRRPFLAALAAAGLLAALTACSEPQPASPGPSASATTASPSASALAGSIRVSAAASLNTVLPKLITAFEQAHPGTTVTASYGGSSALAAAIVAGQPVDVFFAASSTTMQTVTSAGDADGMPTVVARNELEIATPPSNPGGITGLRDFAVQGKSIVVCAKEVPCGDAAQRVFTAAKITPSIDSYEPDVTSVLTKVETGDADAGLVYRTDVLAAGSKVHGIEFGEAADAITAYPVVAIRGSSNPTLAEAFTAYAVSAGPAALTAAGFLPAS